MPEIANTWRTTGDITNSWESIVDTAMHNNNHRNISGRGGFNDADML